MSSKQYMYKAMRDGTYKGDIDDVGRVGVTLSKHFGLSPLYYRTIFIPKAKPSMWSEAHPKGYASKEALLNDYYVHSPDILIKPDRIVEVDGKVHWENAKAVKDTNKRNLHYEYAEFKLVWITRNDARKPLRDLIQVLACKLYMTPL